MIALNVHHLESTEIPVLEAGVIKQVSKNINTKHATLRLK
jgi:hypothetical protein